MYNFHRFFGHNSHIPPPFEKVSVAKNGPSSLIGGLRRLVAQGNMASLGYHQQLGVGEISSHLQSLQTSPKMAKWPLNLTER